MTDQNTGVRRPRVLFVGGYGRSGSTILDLLLDRVPGIIAVGEFRHLFGRAMRDNERCSCGVPFRECDFWKSVIDAAFPSGLDLSRIQRAYKAINRLVSAPALRMPALRSTELREHKRVYGDAFGAAYRAVARLSGAEVIIDSTKYPMHGLFLDTMQELDLLTMHLVRDPRAVAHSWQRRKIRPEVHWEKREMPRRNVVRSALAWDASNALTRWLDRGDDRFRFQRYEDFVDNPAGTIQAIASFALGRSIEIDPELFLRRPSVPHSIAGNPIRIGSERLEVRVDDAWKTQMRPVKKFLVSALCYPQMRTYGYGVRSALH